MKKGSGKVKCQIYSRIVGYLRPTDLWAEHKKLEFKERQTYDVKEFREKHKHKEERVQNPA